MSSLLYLLSALVSIVGALALMGFVFFAVVLMDRLLEKTEFRIRFDDPRSLNDKDWTR